MSGPDPRHFERTAGAYDRGRPPYPDALFAHLGALGVLGSGTRVLELAAGTGIATGALLAAGARVTAVEPGAALVALLAERHPEADVRVVSAEGFAPDPASYDLAAIATAVHWLDLAIVLPMLHGALVPSGHLAVWHTAYGDADAPVTPFRERIGEIVARRPEGPRPTPDARDAADRRAALEAGGLFRTVDTWSVRWSIEMTTDRIRDLFESFSNWTEAEADEAADAAREQGGTVTEDYVTSLEVLRRVGQ